MSSDRIGESPKAWPRNHEALIDGSRRGSV